MSKSLLIFFAVIAAASALRLPVDLKGALSKIENVHQKDAGYESAAMADVIPAETYEREAMADVIPEGNYESAAMADVIPAETYEREAMADVIPEGTYESDAMADTIPEGTYESAAMAEDTPQSAGLVQKVVEKIESHMAAHKADAVPEVAQEEEQAYESLHMADTAYESKVMADEPYESADMKDEYESQAMADEVDSAESDESADNDEPAIDARADGGDITLARRFAADGADAIVSAIAQEAIAELRRFAADGGIEMNRRFHADEQVKTPESPIRKFLPRLEIH